MNTISQTDARQQWNDVLNDVLAGTAYLIHRNGHPVAELRPYRTPHPLLPPIDPLSKVLDPELTTRLTRLTEVFGAALLADLLGSTPTLLLRAAETGHLSLNLDLRLKFLHDLADLLGRLSTRELVRWMTRPDRKLGGRSPAMLLGGAWQPGSRPTELVWTFAGGKPHV